MAQLADAFSSNKELLITAIDISSNEIEGT